MPKPTDIRLLEVTTETEEFAYRSAMKFGGRVVTDVVLLHVRAEVETRDGRRGKGFGSMTMGNVWAWPSEKLSGDETLEPMIELGKKLAENANDYQGAGHPLEITHDLAELQQPTAEAITGAVGSAEPMPRLARLVAASPLEAAIHDAYGKRSARFV
ncbi:unnamed protein product, partial [marine sediment metagenome]